MVVILIIHKQSRRNQGYRIQLFFNYANLCKQHISTKLQICTSKKTWHNYTADSTVCGATGSFWILVVECVFLNRYCVSVNMYFICTQHAFLETHSIFMYMCVSLCTLQVLACGIVQLVIAEKKEWKSHSFGVLCLVQDTSIHSTFMRLYCLKVRLTDITERAYTHSVCLSQMVK